ncbi:MAG: peptide-methionine (S)-S-oxide reductase MsrA [Chlorobi bacterium]|nr:peptide-methionine (S)-S-oxide reductase MsrA [Chlorobiota bacterium]
MAHRKLLINIFILFSLSAFSQKEIKMETATFGSGCFWCSEAIFDRLEGVIDVKPGFSGGTEENPTYKLVSTGSTKYAEVVQITFNPDVISFDDLLRVFWDTHNPTTPDRQGADIGPQYRSVIFYHNEYQKERAEYYKRKLDMSKIWPQHIITQITEFKSFYQAEDYHDDYYKNNPNAGYCNFVINPKVKKFEKVFADKIKKDY